MKILLTNDDGYRAEGILYLARTLVACGHEITICAPERQRSAVSHAVTLHKPLRLTRCEHREFDGVRIYHVSGTPADSVMIGLCDVLKDADIVISGINDGPNMGEDVIYSGTVGAAMEGSLMGRRSIAISLADYGVPEFELAAHFAAGLAEQVHNSDLPKNLLLNVNTPPVKKSEYKGFQVVPLGHRHYEEILEKRTDPRGKEYYWIAGMLIRDKTQTNTDVAATLAGLVSITPITTEMTETKTLATLSFEDPME